MPVDADSAQRRAGTTRRRVAVVVATVALVGVAIWVGPPTGWGWLQDALDGADASAPSCSFAAHIRKANSDQDGLTRCYLKAVADRSASEMRAVVRASDNNGPTRFTSADFAHATDVRSGTPNATVIANDVDSADAMVAIRYADGARQALEIHLANPSSTHSWRFWDIGEYPGDTNAPPTAAP